MIQKAMILAAGLGTRFKPWTDQHPKALALVKDKTLLQRNIEYLQRHGIYDVVVNVHHFAEQIVDAVEHNSGWGSRVTISDETEAVLETGGGLVKAAPYLRGAPFVLMNSDVLTDLDLSALIAAHEQGVTGSALDRAADGYDKKTEHKRETFPPLATLATTDRNSSRYFLFDSADCLCGWTHAQTGEKRLARSGTQQIPRAFSGIQVVEPRIFPLIAQHPHLRGKFSLVEVYLSLAPTEIVKSFDHSGGFFIDVGRPEAVRMAEMLITN